jgi:small-conductance mechanosensitive channel/CRP-like cAMP-binding protein
MTLAILQGVAALVILELLYLVIRRSPWPVKVSWLYHLWAASLGAAVTFALLDLPLAWRVAASAAVILSALVLFGLADSLIFKRPWDQPRGPMMPKLARDVLRVVALAAAIIVVATVVLEQPLPAVLVSSTVLSAVVGLALQDVLKNVFAGMALELEKPFVRGDWLMLDGMPMQVLDTSWRSVRLRNNEGVDFWEPNSNLSTSRLVNYGAGLRPVALVFRIGVSYDAPPARVKEAMLAAARSVPEVLDSPVPQAFVEGFGDGSARYLMRTWTRAVGQQTLLFDTVYGRIWYELKRRGLEIPVAVRTVRWHDAARADEQRRDLEREASVTMLRGVTLFQDVDEAVLRQLATNAEHRHFDHGEVLVRQGELGDSLFVVEHGRVQVSVAGLGLGAGEITLASMEAGGFFGEISLLTGEPRSATVTSEGGCEVMVLSKAALAPLLQGDPRLAELIASAVVARQARSAAKLEDRRRQLEEPATAHAQASLLGRIRSFFKLSH